ncbi:MAG: hypothetical protein E7145_06045 [Rikenellaceae bacterium]|nr:hypothetical protein [Rikenellaceae bacterium]
MPTAFNGCVKLSSLMIGEEYAAFDGIAWHRQYDFNDIDDLKRYLKRMSDEIFYNSGDFGSMRLRLDDNGDPSTLYHSDGAIYDVCRWSVKNNNIGLLVMDRDLRLLHSVVMSKSGMLTIKIAGEIRFEPRKMI